MGGGPSADPGPFSSYATPSDARLRRAAPTPPFEVLRRHTSVAFLVAPQAQIWPEAGNQGKVLRTQVLGHADNGFPESPAAGGSEEGGVAEGEDPSIRGDQPVALPARRGGSGHDGPGESDGPGGPEEGGVTEGEDPSIRGDQPVAL